MTKKKNVFLDLGAHFGQGLRLFIDMFDIDDSWIIHTFEPNPNCEIKRRVADLSETLDLTIHETAVWTEATNLKFNLQGIGQRTKRTGQGSYLSEINNTNAQICDTEITVPAVDVFDILERYNTREYDVVIKMDIEGAEFPIVRKILDHPGILNSLSHLYVEWHQRLMPEESRGTKQVLEQMLKDQYPSTQIYSWR